ncbi:CdaR family protein [Calidifontibacillus oryziterrae]|uniref:CdaR family protein n=1 Tax=Calidifontibacillus oryziterrae TaxID=1191699 RepID=UPI0002E56449|nr:CdaR family protein [Calidifontibacillus oryziterrae]
MKIDKWLNSPWFIRVLALFIALMLYTAVNMETRTTPKPTGILPTISQETEALTNVPLDVYYSSDDYVITGLPQNVNVYLEGTNSAIKTAKAQGGYEVFVDLQNLQPGTHTVEVQHSGFSEKLKVRIDPTVVNVTIKEKIEQVMPITIKTLNEDHLPEGYVVEQPITVPNSVKIKGSKEEIDRIGFVEGFVDLDGATETVEKDVALNVYDVNGAQLNLEIEPAVVEAKVPIIPPNKKVPFKINRKGNLPKGVSIQTFEVTPSEITIFGPIEIIDQVEMIENIEVDLSLLDSDQTIEVKVPVPQGVKNINPEVLTLKVDVEPEESKTLTSVPVKVNGILETKNVTLIAPEDGLVNLTIYGATKVLEEIQQSDFDIRLNTSGYTNGEHELDIEVVSGPQNVRWEINPSKAIIQISNE